jgi:hypothetical protein
MRTYGVIRADMMEVRRKWRVDADNVRYFDALIQCGGELLTLDTRPYIEHLTSFGINFTAPYMGVR